MRNMTWFAIQTLDGFENQLNDTLYGKFRSANELLRHSQWIENIVSNFRLTNATLSDMSELGRFLHYKKSTPIEPRFLELYISPVH